MVERELGSGPDGVWCKQSAALTKDKHDTTTTTTTELDFRKAHLIEYSKREQQRAIPNLRQGRRKCSCCKTCRGDSGGGDSSVPSLIQGRGGGSAAAARRVAATAAAATCRVDSGGGNSSVPSLT